MEKGRMMCCLGDPRVRSLAGVLWAVVVLLGQPHHSQAQTWVDTHRCGPLVCRSEFPLAPYRVLLEQLGQLQADLVRNLGVPEAKEPIEVFLFSDKVSYRQFLKHHFPNIPYRRALYIKADRPGQVFAYRGKDLETDLRHECTHALLHAVLPVVPLWLDEGLAEYFEVIPGTRAFDNPYLGRVRWNSRLGLTPSLEKLERKGSLEEMGQGEYRDAWAWVHFMLHGPAAAHEELKAYLGDLQAGTPPGLLSDRLARRLRAPRTSLAGHFRGWKR